MDELFLDGKSIRPTNQWDARAEVPKNFRDLNVITIFKKDTSLKMVTAAMKLKDTHSFERKAKSLSRVQPFATPWTVAYQAPPFMEFSRQEYYWSGLPFPSPSY